MNLAYDGATETSGPGAAPTAPDRGQHPGRGAVMANNNRYLSGGYWRVRVAPGHPEADHRGWGREHRIIAHDAWGPIPEGYHVHHINHDRADNRLENLVVLSPSEHHAEHRSIDREPILDMYLRQGLNTKEIERRTGHNAGNIHRMIRGAGERTRTIKEALAVPVDEARLRELHATPGMRVPQIAATLRVPEPSVRRRMKELGLPSFPVGRPRV